jgi:hypothetical protein
MLEPIEINDLDQLSDVIVSVTIPLPNGQSGVVKLRALPASEVRDIRRKVKWPAAPISDYKKMGGQALPIYDYTDAAYKTASEDADQDLGRRMLLASLVLHIDGATVDEQCATLEKKLGQFAYIYLMNAVNRINIPADEDIQNVMRSFRPVGVVGAAGHDEPLTYPDRVEKFVTG